MHQYLMSSHLKNKFDLKISFSLDYKHRLLAIKQIQSHTTFTNNSYTHARDREYAYLY